MGENTEKDKELSNKMQRKMARENINLGYVVLYIVVILIVVVGELLLFLFGDFSAGDLFKDAIGNLMGVLAAFLIFDIAHEKMSKDSYASEVSEQILDTLMYHREAIDMYAADQKKIFVKAFIESIVKDPDGSDMINNFLNHYLLTTKDFDSLSYITERDCRIRTGFSYRFVLETNRTKAFGDLKSDPDDDPYFYVQEELDYTVKYFTPKGSNLDSEYVKVAFVYDNALLDLFFRESAEGSDKEMMANCIFRENLDIDEIDRAYFKGLGQEELTAAVKRMFRPCVRIDGINGTIEKVEVGQVGGRDCGLVITFRVGHDRMAMTHDVNIIFHMPKRWNTALEVGLVEPTKNPRISVSYNEDTMDVDMFSFLNKGESTAYENTAEGENGVFSISLNDEWVFPVSGVLFVVRKDAAAQAAAKERHA